MKVWLILFMAVAIALGSTPAQEAPLRFDVVSIHPNADRRKQITPTFPTNGRWHVVGETMTALIANAYDTSQLQIDAVPDKLSGMRFDIDAIMPSGAPTSEFRPMLQAMLRGRFGLQGHWQREMVDAETLEIAENGPKLQPATGRCSLDPAPVVATSDRNHCGTVVAPITLGNGDAVIRFMGWSVTMHDFAAALTQLAGEGNLVVDETGLTGQFDIEVTIRQHLSADNGGFLDLPALEAAFKDQLGLRFRPLALRRVSADVFVVDHLEAPSPN